MHQRTGLRTAVRSLLILGMAAVLTLLNAAHAEAPIRLRIHHFLSPAAPMQAYFEDWKTRVETQSEGRLQVQIFPAMQLGGTAPSLYDQARDGQVDIVWTLTGYTADRFPKSEVFDLPFMARDYRATAQAAHAFFEQHLKDEYDDVQVLVFFTHSPGAIHSRNHLITEPADLRRQRIRGPSRIMTRYLEALGANPIGMPVPQVPEALSRGVIDGTVLPLEVIGPLRVDELARYHTLFPDEEAIYTSTMLVAMNKDRYQSLPDDLRAVIDANSGLAEARQISQIMLESDQQVLDRIQASGRNQIHRVSLDALDARREPAAQTIEAWFERMEERGYDGRALYRDARELIEHYMEANE